MKLNFLADDFTGASDVLLQCRKNGMQAAIVSDLDTDALAGSFDGIASTVRSMTPEQMDSYLPNVLAKFHQIGTDILLYKVCSTFDSSPEIGSIGHAVRHLRKTLELSRPIVVVPAQPGFGRYTVFGNHFAVSGKDVYRLDRHPVMGAHPTTPMRESDLRLLLMEQGVLPDRIQNLSFTSLRSGEGNLAKMISTENHADVIIVDALEEADLDLLARDILTVQQKEGGLFTVIGSGGIAGALARAQREDQVLEPAVLPSGPALVLSGSRSSVTKDQIDRVVDAGGMKIQLDARALINNRLDEEERLQSILGILRDGTSVIISIDNEETTSAVVDPSTLAEESGRLFARYIREAVEKIPQCRIAVLGGDTSSWTVSNLNPSRIQVVSPFVQAGPILTIDAFGIPDTTPFLLKGGQVGGPDTLNEFIAL